MPDNTDNTEVRLQVRLHMPHSYLREYAAPLARWGDWIDMTTGPGAEWRALRPHGTPQGWAIMHAPQLATPGLSTDELQLLLCGLRGLLAAAYARLTDPGAYLGDQASSVGARDALRAEATRVSSQVQDLITRLELDREALALPTADPGAVYQLVRALLPFVDPAVWEQQRLPYTDDSDPGTWVCAAGLRAKLHAEGVLARYSTGLQANPSLDPIPGLADDPTRGAIARADGSSTPLLDWPIRPPDMADDELDALAGRLDQLDDEGALQPGVLVAVDMGAPGGDRSVVQLLDSDGRVIGSAELANDPQRGEYAARLQVTDEDAAAKLAEGQIHTVSPGYMVRSASLTLTDADGDEVASIDLLDDEQAEVDRLLDAALGPSSTPPSAPICRPTGQPADTPIACEADEARGRDGCGWSGTHAELEHHLRESLCPRCRRVLLNTGGLSIPVSLQVLDYGGGARRVVVDQDYGRVDTSLHLLDRTQRTDGDTEGVLDALQALPVSDDATGLPCARCSAEITHSQPTELADYCTEACLQAAAAEGDEHAERVLDVREALDRR